MEGAKIIGTIKSITSAGFAEGGYTGTGSKYTPAGLVHAGEIVWSQADIKRWGGVDVVERMRKAKGYADGGIVGSKSYMTKVTSDKLLGGNVQVNNYAGVAVTAKQENGLTIIDVRNEIERKIRADMRNPSSDVGKAIYGNSTARPRRD